MIISTDAKKPLIKLSTHLWFSQLSSVAWSCPTLCNPIDCSTPDLSVHHQIREPTQIHVHWVGDAIQPFHPLSSPSPPTFNLSQHQGIFKWVSSSHQVAKVLQFQLQHQSFQWIFRTDFLLDGLVGSPCSPRDSQESSPTPQFKSINSLATWREELTHWKWPDAGKAWGQEKGMTEDEMVGWHHQLNGQEFQQAAGVGDRHGRLACCSPWGHKELDMTEPLNWTELTLLNR